MKLPSIARQGTNQFVRKSRCELNDTFRNTMFSFSCGVWTEFKRTTSPADYLRSSYSDMYTFSAANRQGRPTVVYQTSSPLRARNTWQTSRSSRRCIWKPTLLCVSREMLVEIQTLGCCISESQLAGAIKKYGVRRVWCGSETYSARISSWWAQNNAECASIHRLTAYQSPLDNVDDILGSAETPENHGENERMQW